MNISSFFAMGGYGFYVWSAFTITLLVLIINFLYPLLKHRQLINKLKPTFSDQKSEIHNTPQSSSEMITSK